MIMFNNVDKNYGRKKVLHSINLNITKGVIGLIGENGAGKTTLLKILLSLENPSKGYCKIFDEEGQEYLGNIGYLPQNFDFYSNVSLLSGMEYIAEIKGIPTSIKRQNIIQLLKELNLLDHVDVKIKHLSGGMKQRFGLAQALLGNPQILILDEPTNGLDPTERLRFKNLITEYSENKIVIISTHLISDAAYLCDEIIQLKQGKIVFNGSVEEMIRSVEGKIFVSVFEDNKRPLESEWENIISIRRQKKGLIVRHLSNKLCNKNTSFNCEATLEDAYFYYAGNYGGTYESD